MDKFWKPEFDSGDRATAAFTVREAGPDDRVYVTDKLGAMMWPLLPAGRKREGLETEVESIVRSQVAFLLDLEGTVALIAQGPEGERLGVLLLGERRHLFTNVREGFVYYLFVAPDSRRSGVAQGLLREAEELARRRDYAFLNFEVLANNHPMRGVARSLQYDEEYIGYWKSLRR